MKPSVGITKRMQLTAKLIDLMIFAPSTLTECRSIALSLVDSVVSALKQAKNLKENIELLSFQWNGPYQYNTDYKANKSCRVQRILKVFKFTLLFFFLSFLFVN